MWLSAGLKLYNYEHFKPQHTYTHYYLCSISNLVTIAVMLLLRKNTCPNKSEQTIFCNLKNLSHIYYYYVINQQNQNLQQKSKVNMSITYLYSNYLKKITNCFCKQHHILFSIRHLVLQIVYNRKFSRLLTVMFCR